VKHRLYLPSALALMFMSLGLSAGCANSSGAAPEHPAQAVPAVSASPAPEQPNRLAAGDAPPVQRKQYDHAPPVGNLEEYKHVHAVLETERGNIIFKFFPSEAPHTVASFVKLSRDGFYNGLTFHRVVDDFVIQGGDPEGTGEGGPGYSLKAEFNDHKHLDGAVAMARTSDPNSAGSQFYICLNSLPELDGKYTVFGQVTQGLDTVHKIRKDDKILRIRIVADQESPAAKPSGKEARDDSKE
jgi:peptidyl-prolyl cis-trans isomerase B (cyclophilin B)